MYYKEILITPHFKFAEFGCKDGTAVPAHLWYNMRMLAGNLEALRGSLASPIVINSAFRTSAYNKKVGEIKSSFERVFTDIDNESEVLRESLRQINTASGHNELRDALLTLSEDGNEVLSLEDLNHFLQGHKQIEI